MDLVVLAFVLLLLVWKMVDFLSGFELLCINPATTVVAVQIIPMLVPRSKFWLPSIICLLLFNLQSFQVVVFYILPRVYSCYLWEDWFVMCFLLHIRHGTLGLILNFSSPKIKVFNTMICPVWGFTRCHCQCVCVCVCVYAGSCVLLSLSYFQNSAAILAYQLCWSPGPEMGLVLRKCGWCAAVEAPLWM